MAPKRKAASKAEAVPEAKDSKKAKGGLAIGDAFPDLGDLLTDDTTEEKEITIDLKDVLKDEGFVIFFYPKANTGGCTKQACGFNDGVPKFEKAGYKVFGMSADRPKSQANWKRKYDLKYTLLSDPSFEAMKKLGVTKGAKGINRSHIVVAKGGKIQDIRIGISPGDSFTEAAKTAGAK